MIPNGIRMAFLLILNAFTLFKVRTCEKTIHYGRQIWVFFINLKTKLYKPMPENMDINNIKQLFPNLEEELYDEIMKHATIKEVRAGDTLLRVGQTIRSTMLNFKWHC